MTLQTHLTKAQGPFFFNATSSGNPGKHPHKYYRPTAETKLNFVGNILSPVVDGIFVHFCEVVPKATTLYKRETCRHEKII